MARSSESPWPCDCSPKDGAQPGPGLELSGGATNHLNLAKTIMVETIPRMNKTTNPIRILCSGVGFIAEAFVMAED